MNSNPDSDIGAIRMGSTNLLVPDSASEHPMVLSHEESMPLCNPDITLSPINPMEVLNGYDAIVIANHIKQPRKLLMDRVNHLLVMSGDNAIYSLRMDKCGNVNTELILDTTIKGQLPGTHGMALDTKYIYVATLNNVYQFPYSDGQHSPLTNGRVVVSNIATDPDAPREAMPDISIDPFGVAFIPRSSVGIHMASGALDKMNQNDAIIKKFNFRSIPVTGYDYQRDGVVHAFGTNSRGSMAFDAQARLWGADHPFDSIHRADLGDISSSGPAEEINLYEASGVNYGFPQCFTEFDLKEHTSKFAGLGAQWAHPEFMNGSINMDTYCQQGENNHGPAIPLAPGSKTAGLFFYMGTGCSVGTQDTKGTSVGLPCNWTDTPIVAYHGEPAQPNGHSVVHLSFDDLGHKPRWDKPAEIILQQVDPCTSAPCFSPVGLAIDEFGRLLISSEESNEIFMVRRIFNAQSAKLLTDIANAREEAKEAEEEQKEEANTPDDQEDEEDEQEKKEKRKSLKSLKKLAKKKMDEYEE
ncbi:uncharacterized protein BX664DRAFT_301585 [Halteromyces radiatus]|uniref:uncharacterized protein n=1 Tax=Halteromyces radiatus TaxID=101107 RepID=UPI00221F17CB|nr:uncharacterized protein BX664DRAFT_301585 [Halteromyces radiatus]KAI8083016.1 hypothetical protein BX664DRAFT_301585 [Halteromyces radiatus]